MRFVSFVSKSLLSISKRASKIAQLKRNFIRTKTKNCDKMPETSQDAFETLFPPKQPITAQELRKNSLAKKQANNGAAAPEIRVDNPLVAAESNFWPQILSDSGLSVQRGGRESRISVGELDSCYTIPEPIGYKRESSHRYAIFYFYFQKKKQENN